MKMSKHKSLHTEIHMVLCSARHWRHSEHTYRPVEFYLLCNIPVSFPSISHQSPINRRYSLYVSVVCNLLCLLKSTLGACRSTQPAEFRLRIIELMANLSSAIGYKLMTAACGKSNSSSCRDVPPNRLSWALISAKRLYLIVAKERYRLSAYCRISKATSLLLVPCCYPYLWTTILPRIFTWMNPFRDATWSRTTAYRYQISWPFRQVINADCLYNVE